MENLKQTYRQFLQDNFTGLKLKIPLFCNWNYGLRFSLEDRISAMDDDFVACEEYFAEALSRTVAIFETAFEPSDKLLFVFRGFRYDRQKIRPYNYAFKQIDKLAKSEICFMREQEDESYVPWRKFNNVAVIYLAIDRINYKKLFTAIGNTGFCREPRLAKNRRNGGKTNNEIYLVNITKRLIFNRYDEFEYRGVDIIAENKEVLRPIYEKHNDWILDWERKNIDKLFE